MGSPGLRNSKGSEMCLKGDAPEAGHCGVRAESRGSEARCRQLWELAITGVSGKS